MQSRGVCGRNPRKLSPLRQEQLLKRGGAGLDRDLSLGSGNQLALESDVI